MNGKIGRGMRRRRGGDLGDLKVHELWKGLSGFAWLASVFRDVVIGLSLLFPLPPGSSDG